MASARAFAGQGLFYVLEGEHTKSPQKLPTVTIGYTNLAPFQAMNRFNLRAARNLTPGTLNFGTLIPDFVPSSGAKKSVLRNMQCAEIYGHVDWLQVCDCVDEALKAGLALFFLLAGSTRACLCYTQYHPYAALDNLDNSPANLSPGRPPASVTTSRWLRRGHRE